MKSHSAAHGRPRRAVIARGGSVLFILLIVGLIAGLMAPAAPAVDFSNTAAIAMPDVGPAIPYPSSITVSGLGGTVTDVNVALVGITHPKPDDIDILLVGPFGQTVVLMADTGGTADLVSVSFSLSDESVALPDNAQIVGGHSYRPTIGAGGGFNGGPGAPPGPYGSALAIFNGTNPNGIWKLYVFDDAAVDAGAIGGGWRLGVRTNAPTIASFTPTSGIPGTLVSINGANFVGATAVTFGGVAASGFVVASASVITAAVPVGAVTGPITVTTPVGTATSATDFTVSAVAPSITSFTPVGGPVGTSVVITGTNLTDATSVAFGGIATGAYTVNSATQITAMVPTGAITGPITVTTAAGTATSAASFTVTTITTEAPSPSNVKRGKVATLRFRVNEPIVGGVADVTIRIQKSDRVVKTLRIMSVPMNSLQKAKFTCRLAKGTYRFYVSATTTSGAVSSNTAWNTLKVKK